MKLQHIAAYAVFLSALCGTSALAVPAYPKAVSYTQPDGTVVEYFVRGDEHCHWIESTGGYLLQKDTNGFLVYAQGDNLNPSPSQLTYTGNDTGAARKQQLLRYSRPAQVAAAVDDGLQVNNSFPTTGKRKLLMLLVNFADTRTTIEAERYTALMNEENYNGTGSFRDYYLENSYGQLDIETTVVGWLTLPLQKSLYNTEDLTQLITDALSLIEGQVNLSDFDNDGDGVLDGLSIIHQGMGAEVTGSSSDIWSHSAELLNVVSDGIRVRTYTIQPELVLENIMTTVGVLCHEFGHNLGAPDYYDVDYETNGSYLGTGIWDGMAEGIWNQYITPGDSPSHINMWQKIQFGWVNPVTLTRDTVVSAMPSASEEPAAYILNTTREGDYFVLENRQQAHFDRMLPGHGLIIYHVDENRIKETIDLNDLNSDYEQALYTVCASATQDPGNSPASYGNINSDETPFPGSTGKTSFTDLTTPSAHSNDGKYSYGSITGIGETDGTITFTFNKEEAPATVKNFVAEAIRGVVTLTWEAPDADNVAEYRIFRDYTLLATTRELQYVDETLDRNIATYQIDVCYTDGMISPYATASIRVPVNRINSLTAQSQQADIVLSWTMQQELTRSGNNLEDVTYEYADGNEIDVAHRFNAKDLVTYAGYYFNEIKFIPFTSQRTTTYRARVWRLPAGGSLDEAEVVAERNITEYASGQWCSKLLPTPVAIEPGYDYLVGFHATSTDGSFRLICDNSVYTPTLGNILNMGGEWYEDGLGHNPMISATIELYGENPVFTAGEEPVFDPNFDPLTDVAEYPLGFNIYRDGVYAGFTSARTFTDSAVPQGSHIYSVVCLYEGNNESSMTERSLYHYISAAHLADADAVAIRAGHRHIFVSTPDAARLTVYTTTGQLVACRNSEGGEVRIPVAGQGIYIVKISGTVNTVRKIIIQ